MIIACDRYDQALQRVKASARTVHAQLDTLYSQWELLGDEQSLFASKNEFMVRVEAALRILAIEPADRICADGLVRWEVRA